MIDYSEFERLWAQLRGDGESERRIRDKFAAMDTDKSGFITRGKLLIIVLMMISLSDEMMNVVSDPHCYSGDNSSVIFSWYSESNIECCLIQMNEALKALDEMDVDKDGKVSYPEFLLSLKFKVM